jgi:hypothetical protein
MDNLCYWSYMRVFITKLNHSPLPLSKFQLREFETMIDSISHRHGGTQQMMIKDNNGSDALTISLD